MTRRNAYLDTIRQPCGTQASYKRGCRCSDCRAANAAYTKQYRTKNAEKVRQRKLAYAAANRESEAERARKWYAENQDRAKERIRKWTADNPDKVRRYKRTRYGFERSTGVRSARIDFESLWTGLCGICGEAMQRDIPRGRSISPTIDHIIPLSKGGSHTIENLQWAHMGCNSGKRDRV